MCKILLIKCVAKLFVSGAKSTHPHITVLGGVGLLDETPHIVWLQILVLIKTDEQYIYNKTFWPYLHGLSAMGLKKGLSNGATICPLSNEVKWILILSCIYPSHTNAARIRENRRLFRDVRSARACCKILGNIPSFLPQNGRRQMQRTHLAYVRVTASAENILTYPLCCS